jgi:hypothetical protein
MSVPFRLQSKTKKFLKVYTRLTRAQEELKRYAFASSLNYQQHLWLEVSDILKLFCNQPEMQ